MLIWICDIYSLLYITVLPAELMVISWTRSLVGWIFSFVHLGLSLFKTHRRTTSYWHLPSYREDSTTLPSSASQLSLGKTTRNGACILLSRSWSLGNEVGGRSLLSSLSCSLCTPQCLHLNFYHRSFKLVSSINKALASGQTHIFGYMTVKMRKD